MNTIKRLWLRFWTSWGIAYCGHIDSRKLTRHGHFCGFTVLDHSYLIMPLHRLAEWRHAKVR